VTGDSPLPALPAPVQALIRGPVRTMEHVEAVLLLRVADPGARTVDDVAAAAHIPTAAGARRCLDELVAGGLAAVVGKGEYRYAPHDDDVRRAVDALAEMYNSRPVTLVRAVYGRPASPVQAFADAFRLRREEG
jgi:hypothetical protein